MNHQIEKHANAIGANFELTRPIFELSHESEDVLDALLVQAPALREAFDFVHQKIPLPKNASAKIQGHFYRLPNHNRSFCYAIVEKGTIVDAPVLVFKGSEPLLSDFGSLLDWMLQAPLRKSNRVMADHFPLAEGKIPGVLSLKEALREAEIALDVQKKHLMHYGELAKIPTPLLIHSISDENKKVCVETLRRKLSESAFDKIDPLVQSGIAIYVYYYPSPPIRSNFWGDMGASQFKPFFERKPNLESLILDWVRLFIRLLYLGYLPYSLRNEGLGACMDFGNAALNGGFCDPDSILKIEADMDDEFFHESLIQSLLILQTTVQMTLGLSNSSTIYPSIEEFVHRQYIHHLISKAITSEQRPELRLDARFSKLTSPRTLADVRFCTNRKTRIPTYFQYAMRHQTQFNRRLDDNFP
jgi:hypothetical protein